jgi:hypothetical protein
LHRLAVAGVVGTEGQELQAVRSRLERPRRRGRHADAVQRADVQQLVVELDPTVPAEHDIDLFGLGMAMGERAALAGPQAKEGDAGALSREGLAGHPRFPAVAEAVRRGRIVDRVQVELREGFRHETPSIVTRR